MTEHKLCPFCGSKAEIYKYIIEQKESEIIWNYWVSCYECNATGPSAYTEEEAWKAWDRRVEDGTNIISK